jgi:putative spermidine/putrescine transport system substrate-binding protein
MDHGANKGSNERLTRREFLAAAGAGAAGAAVSSLVGSGKSEPVAAKAGELVYVGWGGTYQAAQTQAFFDPFQKRFDIQVIQDTGPQIERSRAEVQSGHPHYDLTTTNQTFMMIGVEQNLWEPIDYKYFDPSDLKVMSQDVRLKFGVGSILYTEGLAFNTEAFPPGKPQPNSWADFWDVKRFPGKRALPACDVATLPLPEGASLADGVTPDKLYPIDISRATRKLKELAPYVIWWKDTQQSVQLLATQDAVMSLGPGGRFQQIIDKGAPIQIIWNQARFTFDVWYVLRGAPNKDNAMRFIAYASSPRPQAEMSKLSGYAPTNPRAYQFLDPSTAKKLPTYKDNFKQIFKKNEAWWKDHRTEWIETCTSGLLK